MKQNTLKLARSTPIWEWKKAAGLRILSNFKPGKMDLNKTEPRLSTLSEISAKERSV